MLRREVRLLNVDELCLPVGRDDKPAASLVELKMSSPWLRAWMPGSALRCAD